MLKKIFVENRRLARSRSLRACEPGEAKKPRKPHGAVRESLQIGSWAERAVRSVADASHAAGHPQRRRRRFGIDF
jgi:hypothetical protein